MQTNLYETKKSMSWDECPACGGQGGFLAEDESQEMSWSHCVACGGRGRIDFDLDADRSK